MSKILIIIAKGAMIILPYTVTLIFPTILLVLIAILNPIWLGIAMGIVFIVFISSAILYTIGIMYE